MNPTTVRTVLRDILAACVAAYGQAGAPTIPAHRGISHGQPGMLAKGDQLVVWSGGISATHPFPLTQLSAIKKTIVPSAAVTIQMMKECWPTGDANAVAAFTASSTDYTDAAEEAALHAATIFGHLAQLATTGLLIPSLPTIHTAQDVAFTPMVPVGPLGNRIGWKWPIAIKLSVP